MECYKNIMKKRYKAIVLSDIHLGSNWSRTKEATKFLKKNSCDTLILCGDIIDGWAILRGKRAKWKRCYTNFMKAHSPPGNQTVWAYYQS